MGFQGVRFPCAYAMNTVYGAISDSRRRNLMGMDLCSSGRKMPDLFPVRKKMLSDFSIVRTFVGHATVRRRSMHPAKP